MRKPLPDRLLLLFMLEISLLLCVLRLAESPLSGAMTATNWSCVLWVGTVVLMIALLVPRFAHRAGAIGRTAGIVLVVSGLYCVWTESGDAGGSLGLACLGLILSVERPRAPSATTGARRLT
jgi:hypothetical protein